MSIGESTRKMNPTEKMCYDMGYAKGKQDAVVHGQWNVIAGNGWVDCKCNKCNHDWCGEEPPNYCENCGARMDGKRDDNENR